MSETTAMEKSYDLVIIGSGPGGYVAAIRGSQLGFRIALVEKEDRLGGTCLNVGCIPSKALLDSSELFHQASRTMSLHGVNVQGVKLDWPRMMKRKEAVVKSTAQGVDFLMKKHRVDRYLGQGSLVDGNTVEVVRPGEKSNRLRAEKIILATGSRPISLPGIPVDGRQVVTSTHALSFKTIPKHLIVIGGGVIGVEIGSIYARLGSRITIVEFTESLIPSMDREIAKGLQGSLRQLGMEFHLHTQVTRIEKADRQVTVFAKDRDKKEIKIKGECALMAVGRGPCTEDLGLEKIGIKTDTHGHILIDERFSTNVESIYAVGDVVGGAMLAHKASEEGIACVEIMAGHRPHLNHRLIPNVVYTWPEVASTGESEEELKHRNAVYRVGRFPFKASGRAKAAEETDGMVKILSDQKTDEVLGVHILGARASDLIGEAVLAMEYRASAEDIGSTIHAHPTFSEAFKEAALAATGNRSLHI